MRLNKDQWYVVVTTILAIVVPLGVVCILMMSTLPWELVAYSLGLTSLSVSIMLAGINTWVNKEGVYFVKIKDLEGDGDVQS